MAGVRAFADRANTIERGDAEGRGEVAVGTAAGGGFFKRDPKVRREFAGGGEQRAGQ